MKNVLRTVIIMMFAFSFSIANAQVRDTTSGIRDTVTKSPVSGLEISTGVSEYVYLKNDVLMLHTDVGDDEKLLRTYNCINGSTVNTGGMVTQLDGANIKLNNGDKVYKDGRIDFAK